MNEKDDLTKKAEILAEINREENLPTEDFEYFNKWLFEQLVERWVKKYGEKDCLRAFKKFNNEYEAKKILESLSNTIPDSELN